MKRKIDAAVTRILDAVWHRKPTVVVNSPPGAGKSRVAELAAALSSIELDERVLIATQTNRQAEELVERLATRLPSREIHFFLKKGRSTSLDRARLPNVRIARSESELPAGPGIAVANDQKWVWVGDAFAPFDLMVCDEAFQMPYSRYLQLASISHRQLLIGDPGQILPVVKGDAERWRADLNGPHVPAPSALLAEHPGLPVLQLPASWRLPDDSARIVQPALYPSLPFAGVAAPGVRGLVASPDPGEDGIALAVSGASLVHLELPEALTGEVDHEACFAATDLADRLLELGARVFDERGDRPLRAQDIGIVCSRREQVSAVHRLLPARARRVLVETANRWQGLERPVTIALHPLSGLSDPTDFLLNPGRFCVMLSRHSVVHFLIGRAGMTSMLEHAPRSGPRILGLDRDPHHAGIVAHLTVLDALRRKGLAVAT